MPWKSKFLLIFTAFFCLFPLTRAIEFSAVAERAPTGFVSDFAGVLKNPQAIEDYLVGLEAETSIEIAVVIIDSLPEDYTIEDFAVKLFEKWGIGKKGVDNGVLVLISVNDRKFRIEVGYGAEGVLPDLKAAQIAQEHFPPNFRSGDYDAGIFGAVQALGAVLRGDETLIVDTSFVPAAELRPEWFHFVAMIIWLILVIAYLKQPWQTGGVIGGGFLANLLGGSELLGFYIVLAIIAIIAILIKNAPADGGGGSGWSSSGSSSSGSSWSGGGSSSGGGGFGGFGGGSSGGGGYSGGW